MSKDRKKDLKKHIAHYRSMGWIVKRSNGGHYRWYSPNGVSCVISGSTISDHRGYKNLIAHLKRVERKTH